MGRTVTSAAEAAAELSERFARARSAVFFGGAGVSTASGIPDFRSADGLYHQHFAHPPEEMLSHDFFVAHTAEFYDFYRERMICLAARPNRAHEKLAELEAEGHLAAVVTQNIDGLHQAAGSRVVHELHGSVHRNVCRSCGATYPAEWVLATEGVPRCERCGGTIKPDVVLYGEQLDERVLLASIRAISAADLLVIGGTSLVVYPAAGLVNYFGGSDLVIVNRDRTPHDDAADLVCACDIAAAFDF
ncbi:NAD-dependent protein deacylase [Olsenella sp. DSM 107455]|uniref:NAD-dependent protein deacetylase n=1 Tax=Thermophilibacter gallinarum TaxID=2779357 RepID=A0ABR9QTR7_9ACTN|nr:NAD-dependent protein deacylase [Thermophilibacter gallinarum]MBE5024486.1 NAD-dependent protein deacylase [Thermophilibacter gallinarum]